MSVQFPIATRSRRSSRWRNGHRQSITLSPGGGGSAVTVCICTPTQAGIGPTPIQNAAIYCWAVVRHCTTVSPPWSRWDGKQKFTGSRSRRTELPCRRGGVPSPRRRPRRHIGRGDTAATHRPPALQFLVGAGRRHHPNADFHAAPYPFPGTPRRRENGSGRPPTPTPPWARARHAAWRRGPDLEGSRTVASSTPVRLSVPLTEAPGRPAL